MKYSCVYGLVRGQELKTAAARLKDYGYDGIELSPDPIMPDPVIDRHARQITEAELGALCRKAEEVAGIFRDAGIEVMGFAPGCFSMDYFDDAFYEPYYRLAAAAGSPSIKLAGMRYNPTNGNYWQLLAESQRKLRALTGYGARYGVRSLIELHFNFLAESCSSAHAMLKPFDPTLVGVIHDPQNMVVAGKEHWRMGLEILGDYLAYVHFKNSLFTRKDDGAWAWELCPLAEGLVNWKEFLDALKATGFDGFLCNEYRGGIEGAPAERYLRDELNVLKALAAEIGNG